MLDLIATKLLYSEKNREVLFEIEGVLLLIAFEKWRRTGSELKLIASLF